VYYVKKHSRGERDGRGATGGGKPQGNGTKPLIRQKKKTQRGEVRKKKQQKKKKKQKQKTTKTKIK